MNSGKIIVPKGMLKAAGAASGGVDPYGYYLVGPLEAALRWLSENPIVPTLDQIESMRRLFRYTDKPLCTYQDVAVEWQRRMFIAPEPEVPEEIKDLIEDFPPLISLDCVWSKRYQKKIKESLIEAFRRGGKPQ